MKLIIAEKPSVRDNIAHVLGAYKKIHSETGRNYCLANDQYYVAAAAGHLYGIGEPIDYGYSKNFKGIIEKGELPMFPEFKLLPIADKKDDLRGLLNDLINKSDVDEIICATDAAREGELIFRQIYVASGTNKPCKRFWVSSVTEEAIKEGMANLKPISEYDKYYFSAKSRSELDWIYGMNLSRLYSVLDNDARSIGRVMTPTLNIIVEQDRKVDNYKEVKTYKLMLKNGALSEQEFETEQAAKSKIAEYADYNVNVTEVTTAEHSENRPLLYSLAALQQDMNRLYGMTASETLDIAQNLYEKKFTTYPRTDGEYLTDDMKDVVKSTVDMLAAVDEFHDYAEQIAQQGLNIDGRNFDGSKINDHHAIIPTLQNDVNMSSLSDVEKDVYRAIVNRFLMSFDKKHSYMETDYKFVCGDTDFSLKTKKTLESGWKAHKPRYDDEQAEEQQEFSYSEGDTFPAELSVKECVSPRPKHFTDATLLSVMNNIDNRIDDKELKAAIKGKGIGTSATRAGIIDKIIEKGYALRQGKSIISTQFGRDFVASLPPQITSAERTARWEQEFSDLENNFSGSESFKSLNTLFSETKELVANIIEFETNKDRKQTINPNSKSKFETVIIGKCPRCGQNVIDKGKFYGCESYKDKNDQGCGFSFSKAHNKGWYVGEITREQAEQLLRGEDVTLKTVGFENKTYNAKWHLVDEEVDGKQYVNLVKSESARNVICKCPWCAEKGIDNDIVEGKLSYSCSSYKGKDERGCGYALWKEDEYLGVRINAKNAASLISGKLTSIKSATVKGSIIKQYKLVYVEKAGKRYVNLRIAGDDK